MADLTITRGTTLPNSASKADFHNLIDLATGTVTNIVNADISSAAGIADSKLAQVTTADKVSVAALTKASNLTTVTGVGTDYIFISDTSDSGNNKKALASDFTFTPSASNALSGSIVQVVSTQSGAVATGTTAIPDDDTIPQITEGTEFQTLAITPTNASNSLIIRAISNMGVSVNSQDITTALFQDSTANALAACRSVNPSGNQDITPMSIFYKMTAGTTSSTTFRIRGGNNEGSTVTFNGYGGARKLGGVLLSSITIFEVKA